jgi:two-component system sensor histidine kinase RpfC
MLRSRPDGEHEMVINRLVIGSLVYLYLIISALAGRPGVETDFFIVISLFVAASAGFAVDLFFRPGVSVVRRLLAMLTDLGTLSYGLHVGGGLTALLYPIYLWVIFGNGFRFGVRYIFIATAISVAGFSIVILETDYWRSNLSLAFGLLAGLVILPTYASTLIRKLSAAKAQAEEASRAKSLFLASVSHELRTPLNAVIGMSDLLRETRLDAEQRDMTGTIGAAGRALLTLINEILDLSRVEAGRMPVQTADFDLHAALIDVKKMVEPQARAKGLRFGLHVTPRTPYLLRGDQRHLQEILINLASNAVKFTAAGRVAIGVDVVASEGSRSRIRVDVADTGIGIRPEALDRIFESFTQADETILNRFGGTGLGLAICKQLAAMLGGEVGVTSEFGSGSTFWLELDFETRAAPAEAAPLESLNFVVLSQDEAVFTDVREALSGLSDPARARDVESARHCLMLAGAETSRTLLLVDQRVEGFEAAASELGAAGHSVAVALICADECEGVLAPDLQTTFIAGLPREIGRDALLAVANLARGQTAAPETIASAVARTGGRSLSILVAEDNGVNQKVITKILERGGHRVHVVDNGERAVDILLAEPFDLVLMDVNMPVMSGIEATKLYRFAALGRERVPIVALTADATAEARERCLEAGMDACLSKPIEPGELFRTIDQLTALRGEPAPLPAPIGDDTVTDIAAHPKFRAEGRSAIDGATIQELEVLGGRDFVAELAGQFVEEGARIMAELHEAVAKEDVLYFRDRLHALRSGAANIGARGLYDLCIALRAVSAAEFAERAAERVVEIEAEFSRAEKGLRDYAKRDEAPPPRPSAPVTRLHRKTQG